MSIEKTKAILHIKLYEKGCNFKEKENERIFILDHLNKAKVAYPSDSSLYKLTLVFSPANQKKQLIIDSLNKMISANILVSRQDIGYFVQQALLVNEKNLAQQFLDKAKDWYDYSRVIDKAQEAINQHQA